MKSGFAKLAALVASLALAACGGDSVTTGPSIGYLIDAPVGGITYSCGALTGATASDGSFHYDPGTACTFTIGPITVGSVGAMPSDGIVTPHDLAGVSRSDALNTNAVAIAQFLQSLDDGTQSTCITIPASVVTALGTTKPTSLLSSALTPAQIQSQLATLVSIATKGAKALVTPELAAANLNTYLQAAYPNLSPSAGVLPPTANSASTDVPILAVPFPASLTPSNTSVGFSATSDVDAVAYWEILPESAGSPSQWQVISGLDSKNAAVALSGKSSMSAATTASFNIENLAYSTAYKLYFVLANANATAKVTQVYSSSITTGGVPQAPVLSPSTISAISSTDGSAAFSLTSDVTGTGYWVVLSAGAAPTAAQVIAGTDSSDAAAPKKGSTQMTGATAASISVSDLAYSNSYTLYFAATNLSDTSKVSQVLSVAIQTGPPPPTAFTVTGTAATGVAFSSATITIIDSKGTVYGGGASDLTGADGSYNITLPLSAAPPFVVMAVRDDQTLVSLVAEAKDTTTNITPVTNLIASRLSVSGDPAKLADEIKTDPALVDATKLTSKVAEVVALITPVMDAIGDHTDPLNGTLVVDGTNADKLLDSLSISITPSSATSVNIEVSVKQKLDDGANPAVIGFTNTTAPATALPAVSAANLVPDGTTTLIADFLQRMTACFAVAPADRISSGGTTATDIVAPACRTLFSGDNPANYKHNGGIVSSTKAFSGIFGNATGVTFDRGSYEFTRGNGDLVIAYRSTDSAGNSNNQTLAVRNESGKLKAIGNQYKYGGGVSAWHQLRHFINQPAPGATYYSTGYSMAVNNPLNTAGNPIFEKVIVTSPKGHAFTLKPRSGYSYLVLVKNPGGSETITGTDFLRIRGVYADAANSGKNPADADTTQFFASTPASDAEIVTFAAQSTWKFEYYLASAPTVIAATQHYKTRARAMSIAELQTQPLVNLSDTDIANAKASTLTSSSGGLYVPAPATGPIVLNWVVPTGALAPTDIRVWGGVRISGTLYSYNDTASVKSTARTGNIICNSTNLTTDPHCDAIGSTANYASGGGLGHVQLWANDAYGREFTSHYAVDNITVP